MPPYRDFVFELGLAWIRSVQWKIIRPFPSLVGSADWFIIMKGEIIQIVTFFSGFRWMEYAPRVRRCSGELTTTHCIKLIDHMIYCCSPLIKIVTRCMHIVSSLFLLNS